MKLVGGLSYRNAGRSCTSGCSGGGRALSRLFSGQLITSESGLKPSVLFFVFGTDQEALPKCTKDQLICASLWESAELGGYELCTSDRTAVILST
jgi:hypothetical protein